MKMCLKLSLSGTICHQGLLLAAVLPPKTAAGPYSLRGGQMINTFLSGPHAFMGANEATSVCLEVPWFCNTDLATMDSTAVGYSPAVDYTSPLGNWANLTIAVLNPLAVGTGVTNTLSVVVEAMFTEFEAYVSSPKTVTFVTVAPTSSFEGESRIITKLADKTADSAKLVTNDFIDNLRSAFRDMTGLHNPNEAELDTKEIMSLRNYANVVDSGTCIEKLDPYSRYDRITNDYIFHTDIDEMMIKEILCKPQYLGSFQITAANTPGALLWCRPMTPWQGFSTHGSTIANNIEALYFATRAWKGGLKIHIQSSMTNKHYAKLKVIKYYCPITGVVNGYPTMTTILSAPSELLEFSAGNQTLTVDIPYAARTNMLYNTRNTNCNMIHHGMYYVYLAQPLVSGDAVPTTVEFNVYMSCDEDFQYFGYSTERGKITLNGVAPVADAPISDDSSLSKVVNFVGESCVTAKVMNAPSDQCEILDCSTAEIDLDMTRLKPLVNVRDLVRRFQFAAYAGIPLTGAQFATIRINPAPLVVEDYDGLYRGSNAIIPAMYYGKNMGLKFKLKVFGCTVSQIFYVPQNVSAASTTFYYTIPDLLSPGFKDDDALRGLFPVPFQEFPVTWTANPTSAVATSGKASALYEFTIPNVSMFKFIGGPQKMDSPNVPSTLAISDLGSFIFQFAENQAGDPINMTLYYAFTDETRFGYQVIAPIIQTATLGVGPTAVYNTPCGTMGTSSLNLVTPNSFGYFSNLVTSYINNFK
jgi:hypothetical protein